MLAAALSTASPAAFDAVRRGDLEALAKAIQGGTSPNAKDDRGYTLLMHAVIYLPVEGVRALLYHGADPNIPGRGGATPLMAAAGDIAKVRLLVQHRADVKARSAGGNTALSHAMRLAAGKGTVLYLLERGAVPEARETLMAVRRRDPELLQAILNAGAPVNEDAVRRALGDTPILTLLQAKAPEFKAEDALRKAVANAPTPSNSTTDLMSAAMAGNMPRVTALTNLGAPLEARDSRKRTPLMYAAAAENPNAAVIRHLLAQGADRAAKDDRGDTALDLALHRGCPETIEALGGTPTPRKQPAANEPTQLRPVREALTSAHALMNRSGGEFFKVNTCISCHQQSIPQMASGALRRKGIPVDETASKAQGDAVLQTLTVGENALWQVGGASLGGYIATLTYDVAGLAADNRPHTLLSDLAVNGLAKAQDPSGAWATFDPRPPLATGDAKYTALAIKALLTHPLPGLRAEFAERISRAALYLETSQAADVQSLAFRILGLRWANQPAKIKTLATQLETLQHANGGWSQQPEMATDAYATAVAVWALHEGAQSGNAAWQRGAAHLRRTQNADGSWHVRSRALGFQPYREVAFPYGHDQWISSAATGFAVLALAPLIAPD